MNTPVKYLHTLLWYTGESMSKKNLVQYLQVSEDEFDSIVSELKSHLKESGVVLIESSTHLRLGISPECASHIDAFTKEERKETIGRAGAEVLAIILYQGPLTRSAIDYIRGVNSQFTIQKLLVRGLIERTEKGRTILYGPTTDLLAHLGVSSPSKLPSYEKTKESLDTLINKRDTQTPPTEEEA